MVSDEYVQIEVGWNDDGLFVAITHRITGRRLVARLEVGHGVADTQARLACEVLAEFFIPDDYLFETGRRGGRRAGRDVHPGRSPAVGQVGDDEQPHLNRHPTVAPARRSGRRTVARRPTDRHIQARRTRHYSRR